MARIPSARVGRRCALALLLAAVALLTTGCVSPTLPLPPPAAPIVAPGLEPDTFKLTSIEGADPNALIVIINRNEELPRSKRVSGTLADANGSWDVIVIAHVGDVLDVSQEAGSVRSVATPVTVR